MSGIRIIYVLKWRFTTDLFVLHVIGFFDKSDYKQYVICQRVSQAGGHTSARENPILSSLFLRSYVPAHSIHPDRNKGQLVTIS